MHSHAMLDLVDGRAIVSRCGLSPSYLKQFEGMSLEESAPLLDYLEAHATREEFTCRFRWEPNLGAIWDNRCTMHRVLQDDVSLRTHGHGFKRVVRRATIAR